MADSFGNGPFETFNPGRPSSDDQEFGAKGWTVVSAITTGPVPLPSDVVDYVTQTFQRANNEVSRRIDRMPTTHEENLDLTFIDSLAAATGPHISASGVVVDFDIHFVGGGTHWERWEVADLGVIVNFRRAGELIRTKVLLLQSKRLYPQESDFVEFRGLARIGGFGSLMERSWLPAQEPRLFNFLPGCRYKALQVGDDQWARIKAYEEAHAIPVHYLLYHPSEIPSSCEIPTRLPIVEPSTPPRVGARIVSAGDMRMILAASPRNHAPSFDEVSNGAEAPGLPVEEFIRDEVLTCRQGYVADPESYDAGLEAVFNRRGAPIAAAIRFDIDVPEDVQL